MERFFSKLDLREIKIGTEASFPPEEEAYQESSRSGGQAGGQKRRSEVLKVSARSRPSAVAGAIAGVVREVGRAEVQAIGAGAANQAIKAVAIARDYLAESGIDAVCLPSFITVTIGNEDRTAIRLIVEPR
ncbi:Stage V sporulation protein S [bacterium HR28]|jgi:stage V sporulation protein S|nr:Stage V sporulation protein S [bacterium HR28]